MYDTSEIEKMDFKKLRIAVQELYDQYVKLKRTMEDALNNIDEGNLATTFRKKIDNHESMFKITAESIESRVSYEDLENNLRQYSTIKQTADQIQMSVVQSQEYTDSAAEELSSTFTMTADRISTNVVKLKKYADGNFEKLYSSIEQTAESINMIVGKQFDKSKAQKISQFPPDNTVDTEQLCIYDGTYYYYNDIANLWFEYKDSVESAFTQTAGGFILNGCVEVQGLINMTKNATIGRKLILQDQNTDTSNWENGLTVSVDSGSVNFIGGGSRYLYFSGGRITLYSNGNRLEIGNDGLKYNGDRILTQSDIAQGE